jgi:hypothetical protein
MSLRPQRKAKLKYKGEQVHLKRVKDFWDPKNHFKNEEKKIKGRAFFRQSSLPLKTKFLCYN